MSSAAAAATVGVLEDAPKLDDYTEDMWSKVKLMFQPHNEIDLFRQPELICENQIEIELKNIDYN